MLLYLKTQTVSFRKVGWFSNNGKVPKKIWVIKPAWNYFQKCVQLNLKIQFLSLRKKKHSVSPWFSSVLRQTPGSNNWKAAHSVHLFHHQNWRSWANVTSCQVAQAFRVSDWATTGSNPRLSSNQIPFSHAPSPEATYCPLWQKYLAFRLLMSTVVDVPHR